MRALLALAGLALLLPVAAASLDATHAVAMKGGRFDPPVLVLKAGDSVTWTHRDNPMVRHTVTDDLGSFDSGLMSAGQSYTRSFPEAGVVAYQCRIHAAMHGLLVVTS